MSQLNLFLAQYQNGVLASKWRVFLAMAALVIVVAVAWTVSGGADVGAQSAPAVNSVQVSSTPQRSSTYRLGETIRVRVAFSQTVNVTGTPRLQIKMDPAYGEKWASYASGSGSANLVFSYAVVEPNYSSQGIAVLENTLELNGGTIRTATGVNAILAHDGLAHNSSHRVDWQTPTYVAANCNPVVQVSANRSHEARVTWSAPDEGCDAAAVSVQLRRKTSATDWGAWAGASLRSWGPNQESIFHRMGIGPNGLECGAKGNFCWDFEFRLAHADSAYGDDVPQDAYTYTTAVAFTVPHGTKIINVDDDYRVITHSDGSLQVKWEQYDGLLDYRVRHKPADDDDAVWTTSPLLTMTCNDATVSPTTPCVDNHHELTYDIPGLTWSQEYLVEVGAEKTLADGRKAMLWSLPERFTVAPSGTWFVNNTPNPNPGLGRVFLMANADGAGVTVACFINAGQINCPPLTLVSLDIYSGGNYNIEARSNNNGVRSTSPRGLQGLAMVGAIPGPDPLTLSSEAPGTITATWNAHNVSGGSLNPSQSLSPTGISLSLDKASTGEDAGFDIYTVTGTIQGGTLDTDTVVTVSVGSAEDSATEGTDYVTVDEFTLTIPSGSASGTARFSLQPATGDGWENDEHISVTGSSPGLPVAGTMTTIVDNSRGLQVSATALTVAEGGTATYTLELRSPPTTASSMKLAVEGSPYIKVAPASLDFTLDDWNTARTVTVTSTQNSHALFDRAEIIHAITGGGYDLIETPRVTVGVTNDDNNRRVLEAYILSYREKPLLPIKRDTGGYWGRSSTGQADSDFTWTAYDGISEIKLGTDVLTHTITGLSPGTYEVNVQPCTALEGVGDQCLVPQSDGTVKDIPGSRRGLPTGVHVVEVK